MFASRLVRHYLPSTTPFDIADTPARHITPQSLVGSQTHPQLAPIVASLHIVLDTILSAGYIPLGTLWNSAPPRKGVEGPDLGLGCTRLTGYSAHVCISEPRSREPCLWRSDGENTLGGETLLGPSSCCQRDGGNDGGTPQGWWKVMAGHHKDGRWIKRRPYRNAMTRSLWTTGICRPTR